MQHPNDADFDNILANISRKMNLDEGQALRWAASQILMKEITCSLYHFKEVLTFPFIEPGKREEAAQMLAASVIFLRDVLFESKQDFDQREENIEGVKQLLLGNYEKSTPKKDD